MRGSGTDTVTETQNIQSGGQRARIVGFHWW